MLDKRLHWPITALHYLSSIRRISLAKRSGRGNAGQSLGGGGSVSVMAEGEDMFNGRFFKGDCLQEMRVKCIRLQSVAVPVCGVIQVGRVRLRAGRQRSRKDRRCWGQLSRRNPGRDSETGGFLKSAGNWRWPGIHKTNRKCSWMNWHKKVF